MGKLTEIKEKHGHKVEPIKKTYAWLQKFLPKNTFWRRLVLIFAAITMFAFGTMYGIAQWYIYSQRDVPLKLGVTFIPNYAQGFGLDPKDTMQHMIDDLHIKHFRLVSYWEDIEPQPNKFDFTKLDWQFAKANANGAKVSLAIGLRQPRWPECHAPGWAKVDSTPESNWLPELQQFMAAVIERYKDNPALENYQLENEYFLSVFGICKNFSRNRLITEFKFVKSLDPSHPVIISRSNNAVGLPVGQPTPDEFGVSVYKRVWDKTLTHRYFEYPFPAWFYGFLAGAGQIITGKDMIIHELQAEPWPPHGIKEDSPAELNKSLDAQRLKDRFLYGKATGMKSIYLWGAEYWYYRKVKLGDDSLWNVAKEQFAAYKYDQATKTSF